MKHYVDFTTWSRTPHYLFFQAYELPRFNMTFPIDVSKFYAHTKREHLKFYYAFMHLVLSEMNRIVNFRYRIEGEKVFESSIDHVSFTDMMELQLFKMVFADYHPDVHVFQTKAMAASQQQGQQFINLDKENVLNTVYITSFPWASFSQLSHATKLGPKDSVPRISWGKFIDQDGRKILNLSIEVHHGLVDGYHVGLLLDQLSQALNKD